MSSSLQDYGHKVHIQHNFVCQYCGLDGKKSFENWLTLTVDHLLPKGHPKRNDIEFMVTACSFCNVADNHYFEREENQDIRTQDLSRTELIKRRKEVIHKVRQEHKEFWDKNVRKV